MCYYIAFYMIWMNIFTIREVSSFDAIGTFGHFSQADTLDDNLLELSKEVSQHFFPGVGKPNDENILKGYVNIFSDVNFNAMGSVTARKLAEKVI